MVMDPQTFPVSFVVLLCAGVTLWANRDLLAPSAMGNSSDWWQRAMEYPVQIERSGPESRAY